MVWANAPLWPGRLVTVVSMTARLSACSGSAGSARGPSCRYDTDFSFGWLRSEMSQVRTVGRRRYGDGCFTGSRMMLRGSV